MTQTLYNYAKDDPLSLGEVELPRFRGHSDLPNRELQWRLRRSLGKRLTIYV